MKTFKLHTRDEGCQKLNLDDSFDVSTLIDTVNEENADILKYCNTIQELHEAIKIFMKNNYYQNIEPAIEWEGPAVYVAWGWTYTTDYRIVSAEKCLDDEYSCFFESFQTAYLDYEITKSKPKAIEKIMSILNKDDNNYWYKICLGKEKGYILNDEIKELKVSKRTLMKQLRKSGFKTRCRKVGIEFYISEQNIFPIKKED